MAAADDTSLVSQLQSMVFDTCDAPFSYAYQEALINHKVLQDKVITYLNLAWDKLAICPDKWEGALDGCTNLQEALIKALSTKTNIKHVAGILDTTITFKYGKVRFLPDDLPCIEVIYLLKVDMNRSIHQFITALAEDPQYKHAEKSLPAAENNRQEWTMHTEEILIMCQERLGL